MSVLRLAKKIDRASWLGGVLSLILVGLIVLQVTFGVFVRYVLRLSFSGSMEIPCFMLLVISSFAFAYVLMIGGHIRIDSVYGRLPLGPRRFIAIINAFIFLVFSSFALWASLDYALDCLRMGLHSNETGVFLFPVVLLIPIGFFMLCLQAVCELGKAIAK